MRPLRSFAVLIIFIATGLAAQGPSAQPSLPPSALPAGQDIVAFLNQSIDWHRRIGAEEQIASDASDESFLDDDKQIAVQVLRLSFDFARAAAQAGAGIMQPAADTQNPQASPQQALVTSLGRAQKDLRETQAELATTREKLAAATAK